jgi:hypothetical protein
MSRGWICSTPTSKTNWAAFKTANKPWLEAFELDRVARRTASEKATLLAHAY